MLLQMNIFIILFIVSYFGFLMNTYLMLIELCSHKIALIAMVTFIFWYLLNGYIKHLVMIDAVDSNLKRKKYSIVFFIFLFSILCLLA